MTVTENGRTRRVPRLEAILLRAASEASRGDGRALRLLLQLTERYGESAQTGAEHETIVAEDIAILRRYLPHFDDPLKPDDALSEAKRSAANQWFANTLLSRLDDKRTGAIVSVMQRVHMDDLTGFLLSQSHEWELLSLPAIAEFKETIPLGNGRRHCRQFGVLSPEREPLHVLAALKLQIGGDAFSAQYQQAPVPPGGAMVKRHWVKRYGDELPPHAERLMTLQSWDTASKGGPDNDWSVCTTWLLTRRKGWYLLNIWRRRVDYPALKAAVESLAKQWSARRVLVEDAVTGTALVQELRGVIPGIIAVKPVGDKASRMAVASAKIEAGQVFLPERADWLPDLEAELFAFPGARHDDQCDSISQALFDGDRNMPMEITDELLAMARHRPRRSYYDPPLLAALAPRGFLNL